MKVKGEAAMTRLLFIKLLRDLRSIADRFVLMVLALSVTLLMFSAVLYTWGVTSREMSRAYLGTNPASATMVFEKKIDTATMEAIAVEAARQPGILDAVGRTQLTLQVQKAGGWGPNPLQIFVAAPDDPLRIETFTVVQGSWPPAAGTILIDQSSFELLNLKVGDNVVVQSPAGAPVSLRIDGAVYDPALAPSFQEQKAHGFLSTASLPALGEPLALDALKIQVSGSGDPSRPSRDREGITAIARGLADWLQRTYGVTTREIQIPTPYAHPHQGQADSLLLGLLAFGVAGLLLSAILVATMLNGLFTQQIPQIGIMKAIGAKTSRVLQLYLLMTLVMAVASTALAIAPGIFVSRAFSPIILGLLGVEAESLAAPWWTYGVVILAGVGVPVLFALFSLVRASRTTVRQALDYRGVDQTVKVSTRFDAGLGRLRSLDRTVVMAFRNIFRRRARFLLTVGLLACAGAVFVAGMSTMAGFQASLDRAEKLRRWDVEIRLAEVSQVPSRNTAELVAGLPGVERVEAWSSLQTNVLEPGERLNITHTYPDQGHGSVSLIVVPPDTELINPPPLKEGRWLSPDETGSVVIGQAGLGEDFPKVHAGDTISMPLGGQLTSWRVVGITGSVGGHGGGLFTTRAGFEAASGPRQPNLLRIVTTGHDEETRTVTATLAEKSLAEAGIAVQSAASVSRTAAAGAGHMLPLILVFLGLSLSISVVAFAGLTSTMATNVLERTREFGVMSAIGATASTIRRLVVFEGVFLAVASCVAASVPAVLLTAAMIGNLPMPVNLPFQISIPAVLGWIVTVVLGAAWATLGPASRASRLTVREALAYL